MKKNLIVLLSVFCAFSVFSAPIKIELNKGWKFNQVRLENWYDATVPGVVHLDLLKNGIIEDPFYRLNERGLQWIDKEDWKYETTFDLSQEILSKNNIILDFKGLDCYADVYFNGELLLKANNQFREWKVDIKSKAKAEKNVLHIYFHSPIKIDIPKFDALPYQYRTGPDQSENGGIFDKRVSIFARKAGYQYGWDWGPRFVTSGIWRPVYLLAWNDLRIENVFVHQKEVSAKRAILSTKVETVTDHDIAAAKVVVKDRHSGKIYASMISDLTKGVNVLDIDFTIAKPKLWWCNGMGEPNLYDFTTEILLDNQVIDSENTRTGLRSLKVIYTPDKDGIALYITLNGVKVFCKGANYVPQDNFIPRVTDEHYKQTILDAYNANMNMLRVWGGGTYEKDLFYDLCDEYGIMVWQDFMFACSLYPSEGDFLENIRQEAIDNVKRMRNHPSIALWCGNNEVYYFWTLWHFDEYYREQSPEYERIIWKQYCDLFDGVLPKMVKAFSPETFYLPSSPYNKDGDEERNGDRHYWGVWHGQEPTWKFNEVKSRFFSEYGFQSFPELESVKIFAPKAEDWNITSEVMMAHQRAGNYANPRIREYLIKEYREPKSFEAFLYASQVLQGDAIKIAIEAHRRNQPYCMGTLFWQHNDCWPVASWASRDYYGRWKAQHYFAREAYRDLLVSPVVNVNDNDLDVYVVSDRQKQHKAQLEIKILKLDGTEITAILKTIKTPLNTAEKVFSDNLETLLKGTKKNEVFVLATLTDDKGKTYSNVYYLMAQKEIDFPRVKIEKSIQKTENGFEVSLKADNFARAVFLSIDGIDNFFENNFFDILPKQSVSVKVKTKLSQNDFEKQLRIMSFRDIGN